MEARASGAVSIGANVVCNVQSATCLGSNLTSSTTGIVALGTDVKNRKVVINNGDVGISSSSPWAKLSIQNTEALPVTKPLIVAASSTLGVGTTTLLVLDGAGNLGLGVTTPTYPLQIQNATNYRKVLLSGLASDTSSDSTNGVMIWMTHNSGGNRQFAIGDSASETGIRFIAQDGADSLYMDGLNTGSNALQFGKITVNSNSAQAPLSALDVVGNMAGGTYGATNAAPANGLIWGGSVGIGTTSPQSSLSVQYVEGTDPFTIASSTGGNLFGFDSHGHRFTGGVAGVVSSCGTGSGSVVGDDNQGVITTATAATSCTLTFRQSWTNAPVCTVTDNSLVGFADVSSVSTTAVTFGISSALTGGSLYYSCGYHK